MNPQPKKTSAPSPHEAPSLLDVGNQPTPHGADYITWFASNGAKFCRVAAYDAHGNSPGKRALGNKWQDTPLAWADVAQHVKTGGNVGMICGKHSGGLILVDIDEGLPAFLDTLPHYADYPHIVRDTPDKAKFIIRLPEGAEWGGEKKYKRTAQDKHPFLELLCTGNQGVIPPSRHPSGEFYRLVNADKPIPTITPEMLSLDVALWVDVMRYPIPTEAHKTEPTERQRLPQENGGGLREAVRDTWTPLRVFEHFNMAANGVKEQGQWTRILGNGGLFVHKNGQTWALPSGGKGWGGDVFDAWHYASTRGESPKLKHERFYDTLCEMAMAAGIPIPTHTTRKSEPPPPDNFPPMIGGDDWGSDEETLIPLVARVPELPQPAVLSDELIEAADRVGGWLNTYVKFGCKAAPMAPAIFHQVIGQTLLSAAIARRVYLRIGNDYLYPNLYALIVANSTLYTKSTAFQVGSNALERAGLRRFTLPVGITPQSLVSELTNRAPETFSDWEKGDQDDWREERAFAAQRAWLMDESASLLNAFNQKTTADLLTHVLKLYDCPERLTAASTVGRGRQTIRHAYMTICGPTTPAAMRVHLNNPEHWGNGLFARFLFVTPDTAPITKFYPEPCEVPEEITKPLRALALERLEVPKEIGLGQTPPPKAEMVKLEAGVWDLWEAYYRALRQLMISEQVQGKLFPNYGRLHTTTMKMAMQLAAIDWSMSGGNGMVTVTRGHFAKAQMMAEEYRASLHRMVDEASQPDEDTNLEARIIRYIEEAPKGLSNRQIAQVLHMTTPLQRIELDQILDRMNKDNLIEQATRKGQRGPQATVWIKKKMVA